MSKSQSITRRSMIATAAALPVAAVPTAASTSADADVFRLAERCHAAYQAQCAANAAYSATDTGEPPAKPGALRVTEQDEKWFSPGPSETFEGYWQHVEQIRKADRRDLESVPCYPSDHPTKALHPIPDGEPIGKFLTDHELLLRRGPAWPREKSRRADQIIAAHDEWLPIHDAWMEPIREAEEALGDVIGAFCDSRRQLAGVAAATLAGIVAKAEIARLDPDDNLDSDAVSDLVNSILDDLVAMAAPS